MKHFCKIISFFFTLLLPLNAVSQIKWEKAYRYSPDGTSYPETYIYDIKQSPVDSGYLATTVFSSMLLGQFDAGLIKMDKNGEVVWNKVFGGTNHDQIFSGAFSPDGGYLSSGYTSSFGLANAAYLLKHNVNSGNFIFSKVYKNPYSTELHSISKISGNGYVAAGYYVFTGSSQDADAWVVRLDESGDTLWSKRYGSAIYPEYGISIQQTSDLGYILGGNVSYGATENIFVMKLDANGDTLWHRKIGQPEANHTPSHLNSIIQTTDGNYVLAGWTNYSSYKVSGSFGFDNDPFIVKLDANGNVLLARAYKLLGNTLDESAFKIIEDDDGSYVVSCSMYTMTGPNKDFVIMKLRKDDLSVIWGQAYAGIIAKNQVGSSDFPYAMTKTTDKGFIMAGVNNFIQSNPSNCFIKTDSIGIACTNTVSVFTTQVSMPVPLTHTLAVNSAPVTITTGNPLTPTYYLEATVPSVNETVGCFVTTPLDAIFTSSVLVCQSDSVAFTDQSSGDPDSWSWNFGDPISGISNTSNITHPKHLFSSAGSYTITLTVYRGSESDTSMRTISVTAPNLIISGNNTICIGSGQVIAVGGADTYVWIPSTALDQTTGNSVTSTPTSAGMISYTVTGTNAIDGCQAKAYYQLTVRAGPTLSATGNASICNGKSVLMSVSGNVNGYIWFPASGLVPDTGSNITASPGTTVTYSVVGSNLCGSATGFVTIQVLPSPTLTISSDTTLCFGFSVSLTAGGANSYDWSPPAGLDITTGTVAVATALSTTTYSVTGKAVNGCTSTKNIKVTINDVPHAEAGSDTVIYLNGVVTLQGSGGVAYNWSPSEGLSCTSCQTTMAHPLTATTYFLMVTDVNGCIGIDSVKVSVYCDEVFVPTAFSPNDDGENENLFVYSHCISQLLSFDIFDRWGEKVFTTTDLSAGWNGLFLDAKMPPDIYFYYLRALSTLDTKEVTKKGNISLVR